MIEAISATHVAQNPVVSRPVGADALLAMQEADYMNATQLQYFLGALQDRRRDAIATRLVATGMAGCESTSDPADRASAEEGYSLALSANERETAKIAAIDRALERIASGDYGWCEDTGEPIGIARLLAQPTALLTIEAQERRERQSKLAWQKH